MKFFVICWHHLIVDYKKIMHQKILETVGSDSFNPLKLKKEENR